MNSLISSRMAHIQLHIAVFLFGISGLFGKLIDANSTLIVFGRTAFAAMAILIGAKIFSIKLNVISKRSLLTLGLSGLILAVHWVIFFYSIKISTVAVGLIGFTTFPIFVTFIEPLISKQKIRNIDILSALIVVIGLLLVTPSFDLSHTHTCGLFWAIISGILFAILTLLNRYLVNKNPFTVVVFFQHSTAALILMPFMFFQQQAPSMRTIGLLLLLGVLCTAIPQLLFIKSLATLKAQLASIVAGLEPVYGIILAAILLHETPNLSTITGGMLVLGAVMIAMKAHAPPANKSSSNKTHL